MRKTIVFAALSLLLAATQAWGALYDFEVGATDNGDIFQQYAGVTFFIDNNGNDVFDLGTDALPTFEQVGNSDAEPGFVNDVLTGSGTKVFDTPTAGSLGNFFMKASSDVFSTGATTFVMLFDAPVSHLSGEIWDVDGTGASSSEGWSLQTLGVNLSDSVGPYSTNTGPGTAPYDLDGVAWTWDFSTSDPLITGLVISFTGTKTSNVGLAIDNITTSTVPVPAAVWLLGSGLAGIAVWRRFRR